MNVIGNRNVWKSIRHISGSFWNRGKRFIARTAKKSSKRNTNAKWKNGQSRDTYAVNETRGGNQVLFVYETILTSRFHLLIVSAEISRLINSSWEIFP